MYSNVFIIYKLSSALARLGFKRRATAVLKSNFVIRSIQFGTAIARRLKPINMLIANMAMSDLLYPTFLLPVLLAKMHFGSWFVGGTLAALGQALCKLHVFLADCSVSEPGSDSSGSIWSCCKSTSLPSGHSIGSTVQSSFVATWIVAMPVFSMFSCL